MSDPSSASSLETHLGYWLRFVSNHVSHAFKLKVEQHGVTVAEWVLLRSLFEAGKVNPSQIADQLGMTRGAISKLADRLIAKHHVRCATDKADRRYQTLELTASGRKLVPKLAALADENDAEFFGHLTDKQRSTLQRILQQIAQDNNLRNVPLN